MIHRFRDYINGEVQSGRDFCIARGYSLRLGVIVSGFPKQRDFGLNEYMK